MVFTIKDIFDVEEISETIFTSLKDRFLQDSSNYPTLALEGGKYLLGNKAVAIGNITEKFFEKNGLKLKEGAVRYADESPDGKTCSVVLNPDDHSIESITIYRDAFPDRDVSVLDGKEAMIGAVEADFGLFSEDLTPQLEGYFVNNLLLNKRIPKHIIDAVPAEYDTFVSLYNESSPEELHGYMDLVSSAGDLASSFTGASGDEQLEGGNPEEDQGLLNSITGGLFGGFSEGDIFDMANSDGILGMVSNLFSSIFGPILEWIGSLVSSVFGGLFDNSASPTQGSDVETDNRPVAYNLNSNPVSQNLMG